MANSQWQNSRKVIERVYLSGKLVLETPAHLGNGDSDALTDIPLLLDAVDRKIPLLTGTSITGALRNYLREYEAGFGVDTSEQPGRLNEILFGRLEGYEATVESWLMVDDARGKLPKGTMPVEIRDGVSIDPKSRTAEEGKKYDIELLAAGTSFNLNFELWVQEGNRDQLFKALVTAMHGFETGAIRLGMRKRRGFGRCHVEGWRVARYDMSQPKDIIGWLNHQDGSGKPAKTIADALDVDDLGEHAGRACKVQATFKLDSSLLIRSNTGDGNDPDMVHLHSWRPGRDLQPVLSGTSLAGALRGRALRIVNTLGKDPKRIDDLFGRRIGSNNDVPTGSRLIVQESIIKNGITDRVQSRVKLDRFTGGAYPQALFSQRPVWGRDEPDKDGTTIQINLELRQHGNRDFAADVGLLLLLLKDLWTGDLPLGGESSVGRGRLRGQSATITVDDEVWHIRQGTGNTLELGDNAAELQKRYLDKLLEVQ